MSIMSIMPTVATTNPSRPGLGSMRAPAVPIPLRSESYWDRLQIPVRCPRTPLRRSRSTWIALVKRNSLCQYLDRPVPPPRHAPVAPTSATSTLPPTAPQQTRPTSAFFLSILRCRPTATAIAKPTRRRRCRRRRRRRRRANKDSTRCLIQTQRTEP